MARQPRLILPGQPHHVIQRGNNRSPIFFAEKDCWHYLDWLGEESKKQGCAIHAYVLMTNHVHLLLTPQRSDSISSMMQALGRRYVRYINYTYQRSGTLWEGRFKSALIDSEPYLLTCQRYIELNPVRAGMVTDPVDYRWSSYQANAIGQPNPVLTPHPLYLSLGSGIADRQAAYQALFRSHLENETLASIRAATNGGWPLGNDRFKTEIERALERQVTRRPKGGDRRSQAFRERTWGG
jgi:putative transposase